jgi:hypothetical protein
MFSLDLESLGVESNSVVLSVAIVYFDPSEDISYDKLLNRTLFLKLDAKDQVKRLNRVIDKDTLAWWSKQHEYLKDISLHPKPDDLKAEEAIQKVKDYINMFPNPENQTIWVRGNMDQNILDSLCKAMSIEPIMRYNNYRDIRTAVDIIYGTSNGYCEVEGLSKDEIIKHTPYADVAYDVMQLVKGIHV